MSTSSESQLVLSVTPTLSLAPSRPPDARLSTSPLIRIPAVTLLAGVVGAALGVSHGSTMAGLRFRAENTHRLPDSQVGWYLYHKSKNYHMMLGGIKEGLKMSAKVGFWAGSFFLVEEAVDQARGEGGKKDFLSSTVAGMGVAGGFSLWNRFNMATAVRTSKMGLIFGLVYGLTQDALTLMKGQRLGYVDFVLGKNRTQRGETEEVFNA